MRTRALLSPHIKRLKSASRPLIIWAKAHPRRASVLGLLVLGFISRFWLFGYPNQAVFDEVYFGKFANAYYTHSYFFDIHPPLGKLLIAGFVWFFGFNPTQSFATIGATYNDDGYLFLRFLPSLASALVPTVFYLLSRELKLRQRTALLIGLAVLLENGLITQGRFILIDSFLILFGFTSLLTWLAWRRTHKRHWLICTALLAGASLSVKWTGLIFLALILFVEVTTAPRFMTLMKRAAALLGVSFLVYFSSFVIHFSLLTKTGDGDAFHTPAFQKTLQGSQYEGDDTIKPLNLSQKFLELNYQMFAANQRLTAGHPYGSRWYSWPIMQRPIAYWVLNENQIWLFGNPVVWWGSTCGVIALVITFLRRKVSPAQRFGAQLALLGFFASWLPFAAISRVMFLYHYFIPLGFAILCTGYVLDRQSLQVQLYCATAVVLGFCMVFPFTYGTASNLLFTYIRSLIPTWR